MKKFIFIPNHTEAMRPSLTVSAKPLKNGKTLVSIIHPNTKEVLLKKELNCELYEALEKGRQMIKESKKLSSIKIKYETYAIKRKAKNTGKLK